MNNNTHNDDFLARWIAGELPEAEKIAFEKTKEFQAYKAILNGTDLLEVPKLDKDAFYEKVKQQRQVKPKGKLISLIPNWSYPVAASIALIIGYFFFFNNTISYSTDFGEQLAITLPDNSEVMLNAKSKLSYNKKNWSNNRTLNLEGEGYFKVTKGENFTVETNHGKVEVLGTQFSVNADDTIFEVICYEGKVKVESSDNSKILTQGKAIRLFDQQSEDWELNSKAPTWLQQKSTFTNSPLPQVIKALEKQYNINIDDSKIDASKMRYTGGFTHGNLDTALKSVFAPLKIKFTFIQKNHIVLADNR